MEIDRPGDQVRVGTCIAQPEIVIGHRGAEADRIRGGLAKLTGRQVRLDILRAPGPRGAEGCCHSLGGCDQPAAGCEPHHVVHRADGGRTSLANLKGWCWWHHHVLLHQLGWALTVHPDGTSQVRSPAGKIIRSHSPPPSPG
jgi:KH domain